MEKREEWLARAFVELADTRPGELDLESLLATLATRCSELLGECEVGAAIADDRGGLRVVAASSERMKVLQQFELQNDEGPCLDAYRSRAQVLNQELERCGERWPTFAAMARVVGYFAVSALPMRRHEELVGSVGVFLTTMRELSPQEVLLTQALVDATTSAVLREREVLRTADLAHQLQTALETRVAIEQAKGVLAERLRLDTDEAFALIRGYTRRHNRKMAEIAQGIVDGSLSVGNPRPAESTPRTP